MRPGAAGCLSSLIFESHEDLSLKFTPINCEPVLYEWPTERAVFRARWICG